MYYFAVRANAIHIYNIYAREGANLLKNYVNLILADSATLAEYMTYRNATAAKEYYTPIGVIVVVVVVIMPVITNDEMAPIIVVAKIVDMLCKFSIS